MRLSVQRCVSGRQLEFSEAEGGRGDIQPAAALIAYELIAYTSGVDRLHEVASVGNG